MTFKRTYEHEVLTATVAVLDPGLAHLTNLLKTSIPAYAWVGQSMKVPKHVVLEAAENFHESSVPDRTATHFDRTPRGLVLLHKSLVSLRTYGSKS